LCLWSVRKTGNGGNATGRNPLQNKKQFELIEPKGIGGGGGGVETRAPADQKAKLGGCSKEEAYQVKRRTAGAGVGDLSAELGGSKGGRLRKASMGTKAIRDVGQTNSGPTSFCEPVCPLEGWGERKQLPVAQRTIPDGPLRKKELGFRQDKRKTRKRSLFHQLRVGKKKGPKKNRWGGVA